MTRIAYVNGTYLPLAEANVSVLDRGFHVAQRGENGLGAPRILPLPFGQHALDLFA